MGCGIIALQTLRRGPWIVVVVVVVVLPQLQQYPKQQSFLCDGWMELLQKVECHVARTRPSSLKLPAWPGDGFQCLRSAIQYPNGPCTLFNRRAGRKEAERDE